MREMSLKSFHSLSVNLNNAAHLWGVLNKVSYVEYPPGGSTTYPFTYIKQTEMYRRIFRPVTRVIPNSTNPSCVYI